jgi:glycosyl hydrolase family 59 (putative galactocerebrosidase)
MEQFAHTQDIAPVGGAFAITVDGQSIYSLTTTTGQKKGIAAIPADRPLPDDYRDDFDRYPDGATPRYFSDIAGVFAVARRGDGRGHVLRQVITHKGIEWARNRDPLTVMGDQNWHAYSWLVARGSWLAAFSSFELRAASLLLLLGHLSAIPWNTEPITGYWLNVADSGRWELHGGKTILARGVVPFSADTWHALKLAFAGATVTAQIDGRMVAHLQDGTSGSGLVGLGSGWHGAEFHNFRVRRGPPPDPAQRKAAAASCQ